MDTPPNSKLSSKDDNNEFSLSDSESDAGSQDFDEILACTPPTSPPAGSECNDGDDITSSEADEDITEVKISQHEQQPISDVNSDEDFQEEVRKVCNSIPVPVIHIGDEEFYVVSSDSDTDDDVVFIDLGALATHHPIKEEVPDKCESKDTDTQTEIVSKRSVETQTGINIPTRLKRSEQIVVVNATQSVAPSKESICVDCGQKFTSIVKFKDHLNRHTDTAPYKCSCHMRFKSAFEFCLHRKHTGCTVQEIEFPRYACRYVCAKPSAKQRTSVKRLKKRKPPKRLIYRKNYIDANRPITPPTTVDANRPILPSTVDAKRSIPPATVDAKRPIICVECEARFATEAQLREHLKMHPKLRMTFTCDICRKTFEKDQIAAHMLQHSRKAFACRYCRFDSLNRMSVINHMSSAHPSDSEDFTRINCPICHEGIRSDQLESHLRCGTHQAAERSIMRDHRLSDFQCTRCPSRFTKLITLFLHQKSFHGDLVKKEFFWFLHIKRKRRRRSPGRFPAPIKRGRKQDSHRPIKKEPKSKTEIAPVTAESKKFKISDENKDSEVPIKIEDEKTAMNSSRNFVWPQIKVEKDEQDFSTAFPAISIKKEKI